MIPDTPRQKWTGHGKQTNNTISLVGVTDLPNSGPTLHVHTLEDEIWHVTALIVIHGKELLSVR
jgi:hypothetical protein